MPKKKSARGEKSSRKSTPKLKKLVLSIELDTETLPKKPPFFRGTWTAKESRAKRRK